MTMEMSKRQKLIAIAIIAGMFFLGAWLSAESPSPDQERLKIELEALRKGYEGQIQHAYNEAIDVLAVKGRQASNGSFQRHLDGIRATYRDCREILKR